MVLHLFFQPVGERCFVEQGTIAIERARMAILTVAAEVFENSSQLVDGHADDSFVVSHGVPPSFFWRSKYALMAFADKSTV
jgi:hypothetical protein